MFSSIVADMGVQRNRHTSAVSFETISSAACVLFESGDWSWLQISNKAKWAA
jgi:hypothetical protein